MRNGLVGRQEKLDQALNSDLLFLAFFLSAVAMISDLGLIPNSSTVFQFLEALVFLSLYFFYILNRGISRLVLVFIGISLLILAVNRSPEMISSTMMITFIYIVFTEKNINYRQLLKAFTYTSLVIFILAVAAYYLLNFNNHDLTTWRNNEHVFRKAIGFVHPNIAMVDYLSIVYGLIALLKKANHRIFYLFLELVSYLIYTQTVSRTSYYVIFVALALLFILGGVADKRLPVFLGRIITLLPLLLLFLSLYVLLVPYNKNLDALLSQRMLLYQRYYKMGGGLHLLRNVLLDNNSLIDNSYVQALITKGIVFTIQMVVIFMTWLNHYAKNMTYKGAILTGSFFCVAFTETSLQRFNLFFLMILVVANEAIKTFSSKKLNIKE